MTTRLILVTAFVIASVPTVANAKGPKLISKKQIKSSRGLCEKKWPRQNKPSKKTTDRCMQYWLFTYAYDYPDADQSIEDVFSMDPPIVATSKFKAADFAAMKSHVASAYPGDGDHGWAVSRAVEMFSSAENSYVSFFDMNCDMVTSLKEVLAGKSISSCPFEGAETMNLWLLRNAVYARHGRKFKHPDLNHYFYETWERPSEARGLGLPLSIDPKFKDRMLNKQDRKTVRAIADEEKKRKKRR